MCKKVDLFGLSFDNLNMREVLGKIELFIKQGIPRKIFTPNVALLVWSKSDPLLGRVYLSSDILTVDGMAIYYASILLGTPVKESLSASLIFYPLIGLSAKKGYTLYLLGAKESVVRRAVLRLKKQYPGLKIIGWHDGYFQVKSPPERLIQDIRQKKPDILLLGMSSPMKEQFIDGQLENLQVPVTLGVGGMFDIAAGDVAFAPDWIRVLCVEWLYRLLQEPKRMWRRYLHTNSVFLMLFLKELFLKRLFKSRGSGT